jgi:hypothetical protein
MASRADLIMAQLRGQGAQIYKEEPEELKGDTFTDIAAGVTAAAAAKEAMTGLEDAAKRFEKKYLEGEFEGEGLIDRMRTGIAKGAYGEMTEEQRKKRLFDIDKKTMSSALESMPGITKINNKFYNTITEEEIDSNDFLLNMYGLSGTNVELDSNGNTVKTNFGKTPAGM